MEKTFNILFIDDQWCRPEKRDIYRASYEALLTGDQQYNFYYETAEVAHGIYSVEPVLNKIETVANLSAIILDIMFGDTQDRLGLEILQSIRQKYPILPVFMMTSIENNVEVLELAMENGANEYLVKRPSVEELRNLLRIYTQSNSLESEYALWGNSTEIRAVRAKIARISATENVSVLITGESGTGKELVARSIHRQGKRKKGPFIDKNCAHARSELLDDELFGHERGAFTGAERRVLGKLEMANGGVLFLDEIGSIPLELQGKLLRVLEARYFQRLGGTENISSDFQLISATNEDINKLVDTNAIREDFLYRINQIEINVPPLRKRREDIPILSGLFLNKFLDGAGASYQARVLSQGALERLFSYEWPGNVRELKNVIERAAILSRAKEIRAEDLQIRVKNEKLFSDGEGKDFTDTINTKLSFPILRIRHELELAIEAKSKIKEYKGEQWKAEFMRVMYTENKAANAKGFNDLIRRLTKGPWGIPIEQMPSELKELLEKLEK